MAIALLVFNRNISCLSFTRITSIIFIYAGVLSFSTLYIQSIGSGIGIYSGLFYTINISILLDGLLTNLYISYYLKSFNFSVLMEAIFINPLIVNLSLLKHISNFNKYILKKFSEIKFNLDKNTIKISKNSNSNLSSSLVIFIKKWNSKHPFNFNFNFNFNFIFIFFCLLSIYIKSQTKEGEVNIEVDDDTLSQISNASNNSSKFLDDGNKIADIVNTYIQTLFEYFKYILEPVPVNYSNELLANQILDLSVLLFFLSIIITSLIIVLLFNILILINMDRILNIFTNKYIRWYLIFNKKMISIEIFLLGISILFFMYTLSNGILFIATHPIIIA